MRKSGKARNEASSEHRHSALQLPKRQEHAATAPGRSSPPDPARPPRRLTYRSSPASTGSCSETAGGQRRRTSSARALAPPGEGEGEGEDADTDKARAAGWPSALPRLGSCCHLDAFSASRSPWPPAVGGASGSPAPGPAPSARASGTREPGLARPCEDSQYITPRVGDRPAFGTGLRIPEAGRLPLEASADKKDRRSQKQAWRGRARYNPSSLGGWGWRSPQWNPVSKERNKIKRKRLVIIITILPSVTYPSPHAPLSPTNLDLLPSPPQLLSRNRIFSFQLLRNFRKESTQTTCARGRGGAARGGGGARRGLWACAVGGASAWDWAWGLDHRLVLF
jgi:hypothetical protein